MKSTLITRRELLKVTGAAALGFVGGPRRLQASESGPGEYGYVVGEATGEKVGMQVLADGGNAIDAVVAAALTAAVAAPASAGIGGFGMCAVIAHEGGRRLIAIDGNSAAPAAMRADTFRPGPDGKLPEGFNKTQWLSSTGWFSAGVPGVLAGLQLALDRCGTRRFGDLVQPAIALARRGFPWPAGLAAAIRTRQALFQKDPGSRKLFFSDGKPLAAGELFRNPELAEMLTTLATANSVEQFYRGDIGRLIAEGFQKNGGLVTVKDMAAYEARPVAPLTLAWGGHAIHTAPLTAGGLSVLQMLHAMQALNWEEMPAGLPRTHARIEAMRLAWRDRLTLLGDPEFAKVPVTRLLSEDYARESAAQITAAVKAGKLLTHTTRPRWQTGTINLSAADRHGNFAALTLSHGNGFGACVTVEGLGLTLGHGMSRFDPNPEHPNAPGPGKRPLHNMVPTVVTRDGKAVLAVGGTGGRKIPNALLEVLTQFVVLGQPVAAAIAAPRLHTEGDVRLSLEKSWPATESDGLRRLGYTVSAAGSANMSAVALEKGVLHKARR
jgi:gamma-glutamyltranspeptidase/glutathione hydrolase